MKSFFKMVLAVVCGLILMSFIGLFLFTGFIGALASGESETVLPREGVLDMNLAKITMAEQSGPSSDPQALLSGSSESIGIWDAVQAINTAATDPAVKFIYLRPDGTTMDMASIEEIRTALSNFRTSGKAVISYLETPTTSSYWLASVSDKIYMSNVRGGTSMMTGVGSQMVFLKDLLDKLGVNVQLIRHGKYKSAGEMYIKNAPSAENLEQTRSMINSIWNSVAASVEESRNLEAGKLGKLIDDLALNFPTDFVEAGLVDELVSRESLHENLATLAVVDSWKDVKMIPFDKYVGAKVLPNIKAKQKIAVIYAEGNIQEGTSGQGVILGDKFASILAKVRNDESVKAVVLRVSSPGGSVTASDKIKTEIDLIRKEKPVIASYGSYAASGGYWISNSCDKIFTDATTLTGSIGVFSMIPDLSKTAKNLAHVGIYTVGSSKHSDMYSGMRPLSKEEIDYMQESVEDIYDSFVNIVAEGRDLEPEYVDSIAQGRVWTGAEALEIGLVDEIGTLEDAINYAAVSAGDANLANWSVEGHPKAPSPMETLMEMFGMNQDTGVLANTPFAGIEKAFKGWDFQTSERFYARMPYEYVIM